MPVRSSASPRAAMLDLKRQMTELLALRRALCLLAAARGRLQGSRRVRPLRASLRVALSPSMSGLSRRDGGGRC